MACSYKGSASGLGLLGLDKHLEQREHLGIGNEAVTAIRPVNGADGIGSGTVDEYEPLAWNHENDLGSKSEGGKGSIG
jgi:hypothetical protein